MRNILGPSLHDQYLAYYGQIWVFGKGLLAIWMSAQLVLGFSSAYIIT